MKELTQDTVNYFEAEIMAAAQAAIKEIPQLQKEATLQQQFAAYASTLDKEEMLKKELPFAEKAIAAAAKPLHYKELNESRELMHYMRSIAVAAQLMRIKGFKKEAQYLFNRSFEACFCCPRQGFRLKEQWKSIMKHAGRLLGGIVNPEQASDADIASLAQAWSK